MDERERRCVIIFLWIQGLAEKANHPQLSSTLEENALSLSTVQHWFGRFKEGHAPCEEAERSGRAMTVTGDTLCKFLAEYLFASAQIMP
jgi:transposase